MSPDFKNIKVIAFDADDTLWENENFFREAEKEFYALLKPYAEADLIDRQLFQTEVGYLPLYGYGIKSFTLSMIETALELSKHQLDPKIITEIIGIGKRMLSYPVHLLEGVEKTLQYLKQKDYRLIVVTKGDLLDQERKLKESGLLQYFNQIEVVTEKEENNYKSVLKTLGIDAREFLMVGNSLKSDVIPVLKIGGKAIYIPFHTTWAHEMVNKEVLIDFEYREITSLDKIISHQLL